VKPLKYFVSNLFLLGLAFVLLVGCQPAATPTPAPTATTAPTATSAPTPTSEPTSTPRPLVEGSEMKNLQLVWSDEFDGPAGTLPDPNKWGYDLGGNGWGNKEWEFYTMNAENASLDGSGMLVIQALQVPEAAVGDLTCWNGDCKYTSARLLTKGRYEFTYGRVEARMQIPYGQGIWPAFWMLGSDIMKSGWPNSGEIDIMENIGKEPKMVHGTVHGPGYSGGSGIGKGISQSEPFSADFHVFAIEWEPEVIRWYMDGQQYFELTPKSLPAGKKWVFDHPFFLIMNLAVGGQWPGYPDDSTVFPQKLTVDYVRVYQSVAP